MWQGVVVKAGNVDGRGIEGERWRGVGRKEGALFGWVLIQVHAHVEGSIDLRG